MFVSRALSFMQPPPAISCKYGVSEIMSIDVILVNARSLQRSQPPRAVITNVIQLYVGVWAICVSYCIVYSFGCGHWAGDFWTATAGRTVRSVAVWDVLNEYEVCYELPCMVDVLL